MSEDLRFLKHHIAEQKLKRQQEELRKQQEQQVLEEEKLKHYRETQLRRYQALERKIMEQQMKQKQEEEPHWKQENISAIPVEHVHPEALSEYEKAVLTPAIGWGMIRANIEKEAQKAKHEANVEKTEVKLPPHMQEELGMKTVPSYKPSREAVKAATLSLAASGAAFSQGFVEGLASPLLLHKIAHGIREAVTKPKETLSNIVSRITANPLELSRIAGQAVGAYVSFKAIGKGLEKLTRRKVGYEFVPEKTEGKLLMDREGAALILKHSGKAVKTTPRSGIAEVSRFQTPWLRYVKIVGGKGKTRTIVKAAETVEGKALYFGRDVIKGKTWIAEDIYYFKGPDIVKQLFQALAGKPKPELKPMKPLYTSTSTTSVAQNLVQSVKNIVTQEAFKTGRIITTTEPVAEFSKLASIPASLTTLGLQTKASAKPTEVNVPKPEEITEETVKPSSKSSSMQSLTPDVQPLKGFYIRNLPKPDVDLTPKPSQVPVQVLTPKPKNILKRDIIGSLSSIQKTSLKTTAVQIPSVGTPPPPTPTETEVPVDFPKPIPLDFMDTLLPKKKRKKEKYWELTNPFNIDVFGFLGVSISERKKKRGRGK